LSIPESIRKLFLGRKTRRGHAGPHFVSGILDSELRSMQPGEALELEAGGREFAVVLSEDLEHLLEHVMRARK
jgi:hypothetical protein